MEIRRFFNILEKYLPLISQTDKIELLHTLALAMEEDGEVEYSDIRKILKRHGCDMPIEMRCKECMTDSTETVLGCNWCGRYFHSRCSKYNTEYCSKQCEKIDIRIINEY